jgi:CRP-like cAMP-binding protein
MSQAHKNISKDIKLVNFKKNDIIYKQGDYGDSFFFILSGTIDIYKNIKNYDGTELLTFNESENEVYII